MARRRGNGEGSWFKRERTLADGRVVVDHIYEASLGFDEYGRRIRRKFTGPTKSEVQLRVAQARAKAGGVLTRRPGGTVGEYLESWLAEVAISRAAPTARSYGERIRRFAIPNIGKVRLEELDAPKIARFYEQLTLRGVSADNIGKLHKGLRRAFNVAIGKGILTRNPVAFVERPKHRPGKRRSYTAADVVRFLADAKGARLEALFYLAVVAAMRPGELYALERVDLNFEAAHLDVRQSLEDDKGKLAIVPAKADSARRIPLTAATVAILRAHLARMDGEGHGSPYVFPTTRGKWLRGNPVNAELRRIAAAAKLEALTMYELRHTALSLLAEAGVSVRVAADVAGHSTTDLTLDVYTHAAPAMHREGVVAVENLLAAVPRETSETGETGGSRDESQRRPKAPKKPKRPSKSERR